MSNILARRVTQKTLVGLVLGCCLVLTSHFVRSETTDSVTVFWDPNSESDLAGYKFYQGTTSGSYGLSVDVGNTTMYTAPNLLVGRTYFFAVTAYDFSGNESLPSIEVSQHISDSSPDLTPPSITLTSPSNGSTLSDPVTITAAATDNIGVVGVQFQLDNSNLGAEDTTNPFSVLWNLNGMSPGPYTLTAIARDAAGNFTTSAPINVTVPVPPDSTPPSVPASLNAQAYSSSQISLNWTASSDNVGVTAYQVFRNGMFVGTTVPTSYQDSNLTTGFTYLYTVTAFDEAGNISLPSDPVSVTLPPSTSTLSVSIVGSGKVTSSPTGLSCASGACSASFGAGSTITLVAKAAKRWKFSGWSGACSGSSECILQLPTDQFVVATFAQGGKGGGPKK